MAQRVITISDKTESDAASSASVAWWVYLVPFVLNMVIVTWLAFSLDPHANGRDFMHNGWIATRLILVGQNPYNPDQGEVRRQAGDYLDTLRDEGASVGAQYNTGATYNAVYPYWALLLQVPLGLLDFPTAFAIWTLFSGALLLAGLYRTLATARRWLNVTLSPLLWAATLLVFGLVALLFSPTLLHLFLGQYSIILLFLFAVLFLSVDSSGWLGPTAVAFATMKPQLSALVIAVALLGWLVAAQWRKLALAAGVVATLYLAPLLLAPSSLGDWFSVSFLVQKQSTRLIPASSSWWGLGWQLFRPIIGDWWVAVAAALTALTIALLFKPLQRAIVGRNIASLIPLTIIVTLLVTPYTIGYDQVILLLPAAYLWLLLQGKPDLARTMRLALVITITLLPLWQAALVGDTNHNYPRIIETLAMLGVYYLSSYAVQGIEEAKGEV